MLKGAALLVLGANLAVDRILRVPELAPGAVLRATLVRTAPGGKPVNVARAAASLGGSVLLVANLPGRTGADAGGLLESAGVRLVTVCTRGEMRVATIVLDADGRTTVINEAGPPLDVDDTSALLEAFEAALRREPPGVVIASGSLPPAAPQDLYAQAVGLAQQHGVAAVVDAGGTPLARAVSGGADLVKPNLSEAEALLRGAATGHARELVDDRTADVPGRCLAAAGSLVACGARAALVSGGRHGAALRADNRSWWFGSPAVRTVNAVGAGDALAAGIGVALERGDALPEAVRFAVAAAAESVTHEGPAEVDAGAVQALLAAMAETGAAEVHS